MQLPAYYRPEMQNYPRFCQYGPNRIETLVNNQQVIGEGDVVSMVTPDGVIQYFFMPISQWLPCVPNATVKSNYNYFNPNVNTWFVRSISNPLPTPVFGQPCQTSSAVALTRSCYDTNCCSTFNPNFQLKFHNDNWTSTTDLYYFFPALRNRDCFPAQCKGSAAVQVELPVFTNKICHCQVICKNPCHCPRETYQSASQDCCMSVEDVTPRRECNKKCKKSCPNKIKKTKSSQITCDCDKEPVKDTANKSVTTFSDKETCCTPEGGCETQTVFKKSFTNTSRYKGNLKARDKQEKWCPKTSFAKKSMKSKTSKAKCCKSDRSVGTSESCDCYSETE